MPTTCPSVFTTKNYKTEQVLSCEKKGGWCMNNKNIFYCNYPDPKTCQYHKQKCRCQNPNVKCSYRVKKRRVIKNEI